MKNFEHALRNANASGGYGLALLLVFIASTILVGVSFQMVATPATIAYLGTASQDNLAAREAALTGLDETETDIRTKLQASTAITTAYRYPASSTNPVYTPSDPTDLASSGIQVGSYYATVSQARGNTFLIKVTATAGNATIELSRLMQANKVTTTVPSSYDCNVVESQILAGSIASVASADLITWAQNDCMIKTASVTMQAPSAGSGSTTACSSTGSGTVSFATLGTSCTYSVTGTYTTIQLNSSPSAINNSDIRSYPDAGVASRTIMVPGNIGSMSVFRAHNISATPSTIPHTFIFSNTNPADAPEMYGGDADDTFYLNGASTTDIYTYDGFNRIYISGTWGTSNNGSYIRLGEAGDTGANNLYIDYITAPFNATIDTSSTGVSKIYFNNLGTGNITINGGSGADIIGCGVSFTGGTGTCATFGNGNISVSGNNGSDIISINGKVESGYTIQGGSGSNIVYVKGCGGSPSQVTSIQAGSTTSLTVIGGNRAADCWADGANGSAVILKKSGITEGNSTSGYARTLTY